MRNAGWIVVIESGEVWTAALRVALRRSASAITAGVTRAETLAPHTLPPATPIFFALEVHEKNLPESLNLFSQLRTEPLAAAAALLPQKLMHSPADQNELEMALLEAGACLTINSPRQMSRVATTAVHWLQIADRGRRDQNSPVQQAIDGLPWQAEPTGLR